MEINFFEEEKKTILGKRFSGNTQYENDVRKRALSLIREYDAPQFISPDCFVIDTIKCMNSDSEIHNKFRSAAR